MSAHANELKHGLISRLCGGAFECVHYWSLIYCFPIDSTQFSSELRQVQIPVMNQRDCVALYGNKVTNSMMCAGLYRGGQDACAVSKEG